jgi:hypothetical protein
MIDNKPVDVGSVWWFWFSTNAFAVDKRLRRIFRLLPRDPRCKFCNAPFQGVGGALMRSLFGKQQSNLNPRFCNLCEVASREFPGGAEVAMSMLFIDVRGSTALSEKMRVGGEVGRRRRGGLLGLRVCRPGLREADGGCRPEPGAAHGAAGHSSGDRRSRRGSLFRGHGHAGRVD